MEDAAAAGGVGARPGDDSGDVIGRNDVEPRGTEVGSQAQRASPAKKLAQVVENLEVRDTAADAVADDHAWPMDGQRQPAFKLGADHVFGLGLGLLVAVVKAALRRDPVFGNRAARTPADADGADEFDFFEVRTAIRQRNDVSTQEPSSDYRQRTQGFAGAGYGATCGDFASALERHFRQVFGQALHWPQSAIGCARA